MGLSKREVEVPDSVSDADLAPTAPERPFRHLRGALGFVRRFFPARDRAFRIMLTVHAVGADLGHALGRVSRALIRGGHEVKVVNDTSEIEK